MNSQTLNFILLGIAAVLIAVGIPSQLKANRRYRENQTKETKRARIIAIATVVAGVYLAATRIIELVFGVREAEGVSVQLGAEPRVIFGLELSVTIVNTWIVMSVIVAAAIIIRLAVINRMTELPKGIQNAVELAVEKTLEYTNGTAHGLGEVTASYMFSVIIMLLGCAILEMFGTRTPASDITFTFALSLITFFLINWFGINKKGLAGRFKSLMQPTPFILPIKLITDCAVPVSLALRLFGNMLSGMIIMDLLYTALGNNALGIPSVFGLFFNVFHPLLQAYIFLTLTLTFIREAVE